jgi:segregation and condensation protein B
VTTLQDEHAEPGPDAGDDEVLPLDADQIRGVEALLFLADEPLDPAAIAEVVEGDPAAVEEAVRALADRYLEERRGMEVREVAGGWRMYTAPATHPYIERWALAGRTGRLTQAALETLAVIAYKQPISRHEIGDIRGVNADGAVRSLSARGLVEEVGRDPGPGQAALFGTTRLLLERLGLRSLDELPELTDFLPEAPAPDEPELNAFKEIRRRLAQGGELASGGLGGRSAAQTNTGSDDDGSEPDDEDLLPGPSRSVGERHGDDTMDELTDRLEHAARNAVDRLRAAVEAGSEGRGDDDATDGDADRDAVADTHADTRADADRDPDDTDTATDGGHAATGDDRG